MKTVFETTVNNEILDFATFCPSPTGNSYLYLLTANASGTSTAYKYTIPPPSFYDEGSITVFPSTVNPALNNSSGKYHACEVFVPSFGGGAGTAVLLMLSTGGVASGSGCKYATFNGSSITETTFGAGNPYIACNYVDKTQQMAANSTNTQIVCTSASAGHFVTVNSTLSAPTNVSIGSFNTTGTLLPPSVTTARATSVILKDTSRWFIGFDNGVVFEIDLTGQVYSHFTTPVTMSAGTNPTSDPVSHMAWVGSKLTVTTTNGLMHTYDYSGLTYSSGVGVESNAVPLSSTQYLGNTYTFNNAVTPFWSTPVCGIANNLIAYTNNADKSTTNSLWLYSTSSLPAFPLEYFFETKTYAYSYKGIKFDSGVNYLFTATASGFQVRDIPEYTSSTVPTASQNPIQNYVGSRVIRLVAPANGSMRVEYDQTLSAGTHNVSTTYKGMNYYEISLITDAGQEKIDIRRFTS